MEFGEAIASGFKKYAQFQGRASRSEYWWWTLFVIIASIVTSIIDGVIFEGAPLTYALLSLGLLLPATGVTVRRLHDIDRSGWWYWVILIPFVGAILMIVWLCTRGTSGENRFGHDSFS